MADNLQISELDFDTIKSNLKSFMRNQDTFRDYDFDGAGLNVLLDLLAYNTHYMSFHANMLANEMFLDTAQTRSSVVSHAKALGYVPTSYSAARSTVNVAGLGVQTTLSKTQAFTSSSEGVGLNFYPITDYSLTAGAVDGVILAEGSRKSVSYVYDSQDTDQKFVIPNRTIDTTTMVVTVQLSSTDTTTFVYARADDINQVSDTSKVYFLQEADDRRYEIYFGDGVVGKALNDGNIIKIDYITCNGSRGNGARLFVLGGAAVTTITASAGGGIRESINSIKKAAPKNYQAQNRAVTAADYESLILNNFSTIEAVNVYGGEDLDPPSYGKVFITLKPKANFIVSDATKKSVLNSVVQSRNIVSIIPEITDPEFLYIVINNETRYDETTTSMSDADVSRLVTSAINTFVTNNINRFNKEFRYSNLTEAIDDADTSITGNLTRVNMRKEFAPENGISQTVNLKYGNEIFNPYAGYIYSVVSSPFKYADTNGAILDAQFKDDGYGNINIWKLTTTSTSLLVKNAGTVNYAKGIVKLTNFRTETGTDPISVNAIPATNDILPTRNTIITSEDTDITVAVKKESESGLAVNQGTSSKPITGTPSGSGQ